MDKEKLEVFDATENLREPSNNTEDNDEDIPLENDQSLEKERMFVNTTAMETEIKSLLVLPQIELEESNRSSDIKDDLKKCTTPTHEFNTLNSRLSEIPSSGRENFPRDLSSSDVRISKEYINRIIPEDIESLRQTTQPTEMKNHFTTINNSVSAEEKVLSGQASLVVNSSACTAPLTQEETKEQTLQTGGIVDKDCLSSKNCVSSNTSVADIMTAEESIGLTSEIHTHLESGASISEKMSPNKLGVLLAESKHFTNSIENTRHYHKPAARPTLADDSKLVKISLPSNPMNIMQSNAQFLNKSRHFLNFITEKSTNIMEKALLPQHLAVRCNSILKLAEVSYPTEKKVLEESCTSTESSSTDLTSCSENELLPKQETGSGTSINEISCMKDGIIELPNKLKSDVPLANEELFSKCIRDKKSNELVSQIDTASLTNSSTSAQTFIHRNNDNLNGLKDNKISQYFKELANFDLRDLTPARAEEASETYFVGNSSAGSSDDLTKTTTSPKSQTNGSKLPSDEDSETDSSQHEESHDSKVLSNFDKVPLNHPEYLVLLRDYANLKGQHQKLLCGIDKIVKENEQLRSERSGEVYTVQIQALENTVAQLRNELHSSTSNQEGLMKELAASNKERESMVMKYAISEKQLIDTQRARDYAERKMKECLREQESLQNKLKQMQGERTRICNMFDAKCHEAMDLQKELDKTKEDLSVKEVKLKWTQNKLKTEMDLLKETQQKLDKSLTRINEMKEECDQVRRDTQEAIRKFQQSEENKAVTLDQQLKEQQARLILERHVTEDKEMSRLQLQKEVDVLKHRQQVLIEENNTLSLKVQDLEKNRLNYESNLSNLKILADQRQKDIVDLASKVSELETLKLQLKHTEQCLASNEAEVERLRQANEELRADMDACRQREAHMLDFTQKLTDKNVRLQSEFTAIEAKSEQLENEQGPLRESIDELTAKVKSLEESLALERKKRMEECEILAEHVAEQTQLARNLAQKLEDSEGENAVLKRKQQISLKEMTRELQQCRRKLEAYEAASSSNSLDPASRTGSSTSLNVGDTLNGIVSDNSNSGDHGILSAEPDRQSLIDRIVKLQRINVKRAEKLDFLEEHTRTLVEELQKKTRIIQNYILHENFGAMGNNERDKNKAELARHGGIMASVYNQRVSDDNMTLELSLEINQKLQAVLEDTLLKNITLKDNIDTLGEEIARLIMQNKQSQK